MILDFGLKPGEQTMDAFPSKCLSDNRKSAIQNLKLVGFLTILALLFGWAGMAQAQQTKVPRIGVLVPGGPLYRAIDGLRDELKALGIEDGKHYSLLINDTKGDVKAAEEIAKSFEQEKVNLIYALSTHVITAAKASTVNTPIVFCIGSDPVTGGLIDSFARPGGRLTGVHFLVRDLTAKRLEILKEIIPKLNSVVTFYDPNDRVASEAATLARQEAKRLGLKLVERQVASVEEIRTGLQALKAGDAEAILFSADTRVAGQAQLVIDTAKAKKLPTMFQEQSLVGKGGLASYGQDYYEIGRLSAKYVQRVLQGSHPKDLKIETVENVEMAINLQTAKQLGLTIPPQVLARANKVIK